MKTAAREDDIELKINPKINAEFVANCVNINLIIMFLLQISLLEPQCPLEIKTFSNEFID